MKEVKLISMVDFVLEIDSKASNGGHYDKIVRYANFLKQPLELWMFVPCDEDGNVLEEIPKGVKSPYWKDLQKWKKEYQKAKERCLFESDFIDYKDSILWNIDGGLGLPLEKMNVENLVSLNINLTPTAIKQLWL